VRIFNANASSIAGELPLDQATPQLWVENPGHAARARQMIDDFLRQGPSGPPHTCPACGEENPFAFELCWSCGAGLWSVIPAKGGCEG